MYYFFKIILTFISVLLVYNTSEKEYGVEMHRNYYQKSEKNTVLENNTIFLNKLAYLESGGDYKIANVFCYVGKYQFGVLALEDVGYSQYEIQKIVNSVYYNEDKNQYYFNMKYFPPEKQEKAIREYMYLIEKVYLKDYINYFTGKTIDGIHITKAGMLAAAHLGGYRNVKRFLYTKGRINKKDAFGTSIRDYLKNFENFKKEIDFKKYNH